MKKIAGVFFVSYLFVSCGINVDVKFDLAAFNEQKKLWQTSNITNYKYHLRAVGWGGYDGTIIVENGNCKDNLPTSEHYKIDSYLLDNYSTVDKIYKYIENSYNENNKKKKPMNDVWLDEIYVKYDKINHIPIEIHYNYGYPAFSAIAIDGIFDYYISNFEETK
jgi:hypothetical protein